MIRPPRHFLASSIAAVLAAAVAGPVVAQTYRIVGPDGRVTFSDRRPTDPQMQTTELGHAPPPAPLFAPGAAAPESNGGLAASSATAGGKRAKHAIAGPGPAPATPPPAAAPTAAAGVPFPPGLPDAVLGVIGREDLVQTVWDVCTRNLPTSFARYDDAVRTWRQRNAPMISKTDRILFGAFTPEQRTLVHSTAQTRLQTVMAPVSTATFAQKITWCDKWADDLAAGTFDMAGDAKLSGPIMAFTVR
jgi:hypothetical protein